MSKSTTKLKVFISRVGGDAHALVILKKLSDGMCFCVSARQYLNGFVRWGRTEYAQAANLISAALSQPDLLLRASDYSFGRTSYDFGTRKQDEIECRNYEQEIEISFGHAEEVVQLLETYTEARRDVVNASFPCKTL